MNVRIREGRRSDYQVIYDCMTETAWNDVPEEEKSRTRKDIWQAFFKRIARTLMEGKERKVFVACSDREDFLGYVVTGRMAEGSSAIPVGMIFDIYVLEPYRRKGIGTLLIRRAEKYCRENGMWRIKLEVAANNPNAKALYEKMGFSDERILMGKTLL